MYCICQNNPERNFFYIFFYKDAMFQVMYIINHITLIMTQSTMKIRNCSLSSKNKLKHNEERGLVASPGLFAVLWSKSQQETDELIVEMQKTQNSSCSRVLLCREKKQGRNTLFFLWPGNCEHYKYIRKWLYSKEKKLGALVIRKYCFPCL